MDTSEKEIFETVSAMVVDLMGEEFLIDLPLQPSTTFGGDLELESIEFVALAEMLQNHYGSAINFPEFLSQMGIEEIVALSIQDLMDYIAERLAVSDPAPR
jgi:acyl carrier protein